MELLVSSNPTNKSSDLTVSQHTPCPTISDRLARYLTMFINHAEISKQHHTTIQLLFHWHESASPPHAFLTQPYTPILSRPLNTQLDMSHSNIHLKMNNPTVRNDCVRNAPVQTPYGPTVSTTNYIFGPFPVVYILIHQVWQWDHVVVVLGLM